ncbi:MAG: sugar phosphate isomerase/epimerase [Caldilineaceae bacterium]|nr:sugar phosphate isomerase/epimerase [Caldilineaceae bacterium]
MTTGQNNRAGGIADSGIGKMALRLGTSTYSYWHFTPEKTPIESVLDAAADLGLSGVEILHRQMESEENAYLQKLKRHAFSLGLDLYNLSIHQDFVHDDADIRQEHIDHTLHCIDLAHEMGIPSIRVNSGGFRKQGSFDDLIEAKGWVEPWDGFTMDDGFGWVVDAIERCLPHAERRGVLLLLENHWGLTTFASDMARIIETIDSPWLQAILDMGNFLFEDDMYEAMERIAPYVRLAHAKTYPGGGSWYSLDLDYGRIFRILLDAGWRGYCSIEMEGAEDATTAVPKSIEMLRKAWGDAI